MNIFVLDKEPADMVKFYVDSHVRKMILETAQMLCLAHDKDSVPFKGYWSKRHINHPCSVWTRSSISNYTWMVVLGYELVSEFVYRSKHKDTHATLRVIDWCANNIPDIYDTELTEHPLCMPDKYKLSDPISSYRNYYKYGKSHLHSWTKRQVPYWINENTT